MTYLADFNKGYNLLLGESISTLFSYFTSYSCKVSYDE